MGLKDISICAPVYALLLLTINIEGSGKSRAALVEGSGFPSFSLNCSPGNKPTIRRVIRHSREALPAVRGDG